MFFWILAILILGIVTTVGYYQGGVRAAVSLIGLFVAALLAVPLSFIPAAILPAFGMKHDVLLAFIPPVIIFIAILAIIKGGGFVLHRKLDVYFRHKSSETQLGLWERLNTRLGICLGLANGMVYVFLISIILHLGGYFTSQIATSPTDHWSIRIVNTLNDNMESTKFDKALAPFVPATPFYYDAVDILSYIYHTPLLQYRLATYPIFLPLGDESRFKNIAEDNRFQEFWVKKPTIGEFYNHERIKPLAQDPELYSDLVELLENDLTDFKKYLETGESEKYKEHKLVGRWNFSFKSSWNLARRNKPNMTVQEREFVMNSLQAFWAKTMLTAYLDGKLAFKRGSGKASNGKWKKEYGTKFTLTIPVGGNDMAMEGIVKGTTLTLTAGRLSLVYKR